MPDSDVADDEFETPEQFPRPPRLEPGAPAPLLDVPQPEVGSRVFVDTSATFTHQAPLVASARLGILHVYWTPYVAAEIARVATRQFAMQELREAFAANPRLRVQEAIQKVRHQLDDAIAAFERSWTVPSPEAIRGADGLFTDKPLPDEKDRSILVGAAAAECTFLLSRDKRSFPHGQRFGGIVCWHPDTFLTVLFQSQPDAYYEVSALVATSPGRQLLP